MFSKLAFLATTASLAAATVIPLTPATADTGAPCLVQYTPDTTGQWTNATVLLRSGPNLDMTLVTPVIEGFDATTGGEIAWTCPAVTINSAIYFYEFNIGGLNATWTTRFAIASTAGKTTTPTNTTAGVEWGTGKLASDATVASASVSGATAGASSTGSASSTASSSSAASTSTSSDSSSSDSSSSSSGISSAGSGSATRSASNAAATTAAASGAGALVAQSAMGLALLAAGVVALA